MVPRARDPAGRQVLRLRSRPVVLRLHLRRVVAARRAALPVPHRERDGGHHLQDRRHAIGALLAGLPSAARGADERVPAARELHHDPRRRRQPRQDAQERAAQEVPRGGLHAGRALAPAAPHHRALRGGLRAAQRVPHERPEPAKERAACARVELVHRGAAAHTAHARRDQAAEAQPRRGDQLRHPRERPRTAESPGQRGAGAGERRRHRRLDQGQARLLVI
mmetsp:Transcript_32597/g.83096  ORF Transcript_32597/g.83096 Transcript_32597/m.83096 type:complete len:222 (+) Transcript_32597:767-1432(+)